MSETNFYPVKHVLKLLAKLLLSVMIASAMISGNLVGMKTLIMVAGIIQIVPMIFSLLNKDNGGWAFVAIVLALILFNFGGSIVFTIGAILLGLMIVYFPLGDLAYNYGNFRGCLRANRGAKRLSRALSGVVADCCLVATGVCLIVCRFVGLFYILGGVLGYVAFAAYVVKLVMNVVCQDFRN